MHVGRGLRRVHPGVARVPVPWDAAAEGLGLEGSRGPRGENGRMADILLCNSAFG